MPERIRCQICGSQAAARSRQAALTTPQGKGAVTWGVQRVVMSDVDLIEAFPAHFKQRASGPADQRQTNKGFEMENPTDSSDAAQTCSVTGNPAMCVLQCD